MGKTIPILYAANQRLGSGPGSTRIHCIWPDLDPDPGKEIEVDPVKMIQMTQ